MQNRTKIGLATGANVIASLFTKLYYFSLNEINTMVSEFLAEKVDLLDKKLAEKWEGNLNLLSA